MENIFSFLCILSVSAIASAVVCPSPFIALGENCYYFRTDGKTWQGARDTCAIYAGDLAVFDVECEDYDKVFNYATELGIDNAWIGGSDSVFEGQWRWVNDNPMDLARLYWADGKPTSDSNLNCAFMTKVDYRRRLADSSCTTARPYICQTTPTLL